MSPGQLPQRRLGAPGRPPGAALPRRGAGAAAGDAPGPRAAQRVAARGQRGEGNDPWEGMVEYIKYLYIPLKTMGK